MVEWIQCDTLAIVSNLAIVQGTMFDLRFCRSTLDETLGCLKS